MDNSQKKRIFNVIMAILLIVMMTSIIIFTGKEKAQKDEEQKTEQAENTYNPYISGQGSSVSNNSGTDASVIYDDQNNTDYKDARKLLYYVENQSSFNCEIFKIDENKKITSTYDKYGYKFDEKSVKMYIKQITETLSIYGKDVSSAPAFDELEKKAGYLMKTVFFDSNHNNTVTMYTYIVNSKNYNEKEDSNSITVLTDGKRFITCDDYATNTNYVTMADSVITNFSDSLDIASPADDGKDN